MADTARMVCNHGPANIYENIRVECRGEVRLHNRMKDEGTTKRWKCTKCGNITSKVGAYEYEALHHIPK